MNFAYFGQSFCLAGTQRPLIWVWANFPAPLSAVVALFPSEYLFALVASPAREPRHRWLVVCFLLKQ